MDKKEFIKTLEDNLKHKPDIVKEIISDFNEHFDEANKNGKSEAEVCEILGDPIEIANNFNEEIEEEIVSKEGREEIFVNIRFGNIILDYYEGDSFNVKVLSRIGTVSDDNIKISKKNGGLYIEEMEMDLLDRIITLFRHRKILISVPKSFKGSVYIKTVSGNLTMNNINTPNEIRCNVISGNTRLINVKTEKEFNIYEKSGNVHMTDCIGDTMIRGCSGNISVEFHKGNVAASNISGNIDIETNSISKASTIGTKSGNVKIDLNELLSNLNIYCVSGNIKFKIDNVFGNINGETKSGNVTGIIKEENKAICMLDYSGHRNKLRNNIPDDINVPVINLRSRSGRVNIKY